MTGSSSKKGKKNDTEEKGLIFRVNTDLMENYLGKQHHLQTDNFYTSIALFNYLEKVIHMDMVLSSRERPADLSRILNLKSGEKGTVHSSNQSISVGKCR